MRFLHFSDQHWFPLSRHAEYKVVFSELFDIARSMNVDAFVLTGDCVNDKTQRITPELIDCLVWFFGELASIAPTHIILGNHDGNLSNSGRQDAISPIIKAMNLPNLHLYKESGVYAVNQDFNFCVFSCFDEDGWKNVFPEENKVNIALFHGGIFGATTDTGHVFQSTEIDSNFFDGYDFAFLGDVHQQQYLTSDRRIAYPGSTVQQNFGEEIDKHGFLLWDIRNKNDFNVSFHKLTNHQPFVNLEWNADVDKLLTKAFKYPDFSRFRILSKDTLSDVDKSKITRELQEKKKSNHIVFKPEKRIINLIEGASSIKESLRDSKVLLGLVKNFIGKDKINDKKSDFILQEIEKYVSKLSNNDQITRNTKVIIKRLEFDNLFGYSEGNYINFDNVDGTVGVFGANGAGKSSIIASIIYSLFGTVERDLGQGKTQYLINLDKNECCSKVWINVSGVDYLIERKTLKKNRGDKVGVQNLVSFYRLDPEGNIEEKLDGVSPTETDKEIIKKIGNVEDFLLTTVAAQRNMGRFIEEKSTKRKEIVSRFRDLLVLDEIYNFIKDDFTDIKAQVKNISVKNWEEEIEKLADEKIELENKLENLNIEEELFNASLLSVSSELASLVNQESVNPSDIQKEELLLLDLTSEHDGLVKKVKQDDDTKLILNKTLSLIIKEKEMIPIDDYRDIFTKSLQLEQLLSNLNIEFIGETRQLNEKKKTILKLVDVPCGDSFPSCKYIRDAHEEKKRLPDQEKLVNLLNDKIVEAKARFSEINKNEIEKKISRFSEIELEQSNIEKKLSSFNTEVLKINIEVLSKKIVDSKAKISAMKQNIHADIQEKINLLTEEKIKINKSIRTTNDEKMSIAKRIGQLNSEYIKLRDDSKKFGKINEKYQIYEMLLAAFSKKGIQSQIMKIELPIINKEIEAILENAVNFKIDLEIDEESDRLEIYLEDEKGRRPIECGGGCENVIASMAIRVGLTGVSNLPKSNILIFDEAFNALDPNHVDSVSKVFENLKKWFKAIMVISHDERVKNVCDNILDIKQKGKYVAIEHD